MVNPGQYTFQKRVGYIVLKPILVYKRQYSKSPIVKPVEKRKKLDIVQSSRAKLYSPLQNPIIIEDDQVVTEHLRHLGSQDDIIVTTVELDEGIP